MFHADSFACSSEKSNNERLSVLNIISPEGVSILSYLLRNVDDVSLLFACRSLGQGSEKLRYILSTSPLSNIDSMFSASNLISLILLSSSVSTFSIARIMTLENFSIPIYKVLGLFAACSVRKRPFPC